MEINGFSVFAFIYVIGFVVTLWRLSRWLRATPKEESFVDYIEMTALWLSVYWPLFILVCAGYYSWKRWQSFRHPRPSIQH